MAAAQGKVIITCAVTGSIHTPSMSPHLPVTPAEIARGAIGAAQAGAAIVHLHARNPKDGSPSQDPALFHEFLPQIAVASDVVINLTTGGAATMTTEERLQPALQLKPEVASLNMGSMNFGLYEMLGRYKDFKYDWEKPYLAGSDDRIFSDAYYWSVLGAGRNQMFIAAMSAVMGGNVRVGLEDSLWLGRGQLAKSNAEQVAKAKRMLEELGLAVATANDAREMLKLRGARNVAF